MNPDTPRDARHGARTGRATSRTDGGNATGGITARIAANVDGEGRTVAARSGNGTGKRTTGGTFGRRSEAAHIRDRPRGCRPSRVTGPDVRARLIGDEVQCGNVRARYITAKNEASKQIKSV